MSGLWEAERVENRLNKGTPDVTWAANGRTGWMELKWERAWPATPGGRLPVRSLTEEQRNWIRRFGRAGAATYILIGVGQDEYFLFDHRLIDEVGWMNQEQMRNQSLLDYGWSMPVWTKLHMVIAGNIGRRFG